MFSILYTIEARENGRKMASSCQKSDNITDIRPKNALVDRRYTRGFRVWEAFSNYLNRLTLYARNPLFCGSSRRKYGENVIFSIYKLTDMKVSRRLFNDLRLYWVEINVSRVHVQRSILHPDTEF